MELETRLKEETKSRNRAERRLKSLIKKLESLEIFYVSDESERSGFLEKSEISSASSVASTSTKEADNHSKPVKINPNVTPASSTHNSQEQPAVPQIPPTQESSSFPDMDSRPNNVSKIKVSSSESFVTPADEKLETAEITNPTTSSAEKCPESPTPMENSSSVTEEEDIAKSSTSASTETESNSSKCGGLDLNKENQKEKVEQDDDENVDNSLAIVAIDLPKKEQRIDPVVLDATVKEVLDALRHAKQKLQTSMERRRMIRVG
ncbi:OLC1v1034698C1 [Oldenlandia corymbosa var. corymbosa]|nr:OLC1v1034698C1 [Oldenlandia corymbosa var. corymbosa]